MTNRLLTLLIASLLFINAAHAASDLRKTSKLTEWDFLLDTAYDAPDKLPADNAAANLIADTSKWSQVQVPHVFRQSGLPDNSAAWYRTTIEAKPNKKRYLLRLEGAASVCDVYANGKRVGRHRGAYTASVYDLTDALEKGANAIAIRVSNGDHEAYNCLSHSTLYVTNGGLYRPAWLVETGPVYFDPYMGSTGLFLTGKQDGTLAIEAHVRNTLDRDAEVTGNFVVTDPDGNEVAAVNVQGKAEAGASTTLQATVLVKDVKLWGIRQPNLYTVTGTLKANGKKTDELSERTGFRTVESVDGNFRINGETLLVRGVNKHQQTEREWNAIPDEQLVHEWDLMDGMNVNAVRLAHYPHRRFEYDIADEKGIGIWAENGLAGQLWQKEVGRDSGEREPTTDGDRITREMVWQNRNHPSIIFWSSGNETYEKVAAHYADIIRETDTSRLITYASAHTDRPDTVDFVAGNTYQGWYGGHFSDFNKPGQNRYVSETGAGTWFTHHIPQGEARWKVNDFETVEYGNLFTEYRMQSVFVDQPERHSMYLWWNFREFYDRKFKNNRNTKGMITMSGKPKDVYYLHKAFFNPAEPLLHITSRYHFYRWFDADNGTKVYSNADWVELSVNGKPQGRKQNGEYHQPIATYPDGWRNADGERVGKMINNVFFWNAKLEPGRNVIEARDANGQVDTVVVYQWRATEQPNDWIDNLTSSNPENKAHFIERPVEEQAPFYYMVDGSSDNTFDLLPEHLDGASWIATKRLSDPALKTDLSFKLKKDATVFVMCSTGTFPPIVLREPNADWVKSAAALGESLKAGGFKRSDEPAIWRGHDAWLADAALWGRKCRAGETIRISGQTLDYVVLIRE